MDRPSTPRLLCADLAEPLINSKQPTKARRLPRAHANWAASIRRNGVSPGRSSRSGCPSTAVRVVTVGDLLEGP